MSQFNPIEAMASAKHEFGEHGGVNMSVETSTTFTVMSAETMPEIFQGHRGPNEGGCFLYGRHFNPTVYVLGRQIAAMEGAAAGYCTASGLGAISSALLQLCDTGDHIVAADTIYGGTHALLHEYLPLKTGITATSVPVDDLAAVDAAFTKQTKVLFVETLSNPTLVVADLPKLAAIAHKHGAQLVVDNTFTPLVVSPLQHGADVVVHSLTKFINGASDIIAGAVCGSEELVSSLMDLHTGSLMLLGPTMDPRVASEISLRLPHLGLRMVEHSERAMKMVERLSKLGMRVKFPGLSDHPQHALLDSLRNKDFGWSGLFTIDLETPARADRLMDTLQNKYNFGFMAVSLGFFDTLMSCSGSSTSCELTDEEKQASGISPGLVRISIGYTGSIEQRMDQMESALRELGEI